MVLGPHEVSRGVKEEYLSNRQEYLVTSDGEGDVGMDRNGRR